MTHVQQLIVIVLIVIFGLLTIEWLVKLLNRSNLTWTGKIVIAVGLIVAVALIKYFFF